MLTADLREQLAAGITSAASEVRFDYPVKRHTTLGIGGVAAAFVVVSTKDELAFMLQFGREQNLPLLCLGKGSNVLLAAEYFPGIVFRLGGVFAEIAVEEEGDTGGVVYCGAGVGLGRLSRFCIEQGFSGLEFAAAIPGTVGGAVLMNAGAWGREMAGVTHSVELQGVEGSLVATGDMLDFIYRRWPWLQRQDEKLVIIGVRLNLTRDTSESISARCRELAVRRKKTQQVKKPSAGSFFKNPPQQSAGRLIESCGLKGLRVGDAMVAEEHANFFVNMGEATAADMLELMERVQQKVESIHGIRLEPEVRIIR